MGDITEGNRRRDEAIKQVFDAADTLWKRLALQTVLEVAENKEYFTTDDVWNWPSFKRNQVVAEPRAMGGIIRAAMKAGWIESTDRFIRSVRPACHRRPLAVWKSGFIKI